MAGFVPTFEWVNVEGWMQLQLPNLARVFTHWHLFNFAYETSKSSVEREPVISLFNLYPLLGSEIKNWSSKSVSSG